jgi:hypothetical protein
MRFARTPFNFTVPLLRNSAAPDAAANPGGWVKTVPPLPTRSRWAFGLLLAGATALAATVVAIRTVPWFGPLIADQLRSMVGSENVTRLEEVVADVEDRVQKTANNRSASSLSDSTPEDLLGVEKLTPALSLALANRPADVTPEFPKVASPEDGAWQPVVTNPGEAPVMYRSLLHPDPERTYSELFLFALDLSRVKVNAVAGSVEPKSPSNKRGAARPGVVPEADRGRLIAAFNGGFKAEHGQFGMMVGGEELLAPRSTSCTFAAAPDGSLKIAAWPNLSKDAGSYAWWRQTPGCMLENGVLHPGLRAEGSKNWGATLDGDTVIRRSAVGLSEKGDFLFVGIGKSTTARALATGMRRAGAVHVAQLDVNFSYPRFLLYRRDAETRELTAHAPVKGLLYTRDEYLGRPSTRDFFYVTTR